MKWLFLCSGLMLGLAGTAQAQGLIWNLPENGSWVRYEGTYTQVVNRPDAAEGSLSVQWARIITIKSLGTEEAEYQGKTQPCRWLEIKSETGKTAEGVLEPGPGGVRIYKILVPESAIQGKTLETVEDGRTIPVALIPVVKGMRKIGDKPAEPIPSGAFDLYPVVSLLKHFENLTESGDAQSVQVPAGNFEATPFQGSSTAETTAERSTSTVDLLRSEKIPFGLVKWTAKTTVESKATTDDRADFKESIVVSEVMEAAAVGEGAESELTE